MAIHRRLLWLPNACPQAVTQAVRGRHPQADRVQFLGDGELLQASNAATGVKGAGQCLDRAGDWTPFAYTCTYNIRSGETSGVTVHLRQAEAGSGGGGWGGFWDAGTGHRSGKSPLPPIFRDRPKETC
jgi:hypothetical protein